MKPMQKFRDGDIGPVVILTVICAVIALALAGIYQMTAPVIETRKIETANEVRREVMPLSDSFSAIEGIALPEGVFEVYRADNGEGFVFRSGAKGFSGTVTFMIGMDKNGEITGINMFEHNETPGLGTKIGDPAYLGLYYGFADYAGVDAVSGATKTTNALKNAIAQTKEAFEAVKGTV